MLCLSKEAGCHPSPHHEAIVGQGSHSRAVRVAAPVAATPYGRHFGSHGRHFGSRVRHFGSLWLPFWGPVSAILGPHGRHFGVRSIEGRNRPQVVLSHVFSSLILSFSPVFSQVEHQNNFPMPWNACSLWGALRRVRFGMGSAGVFFSAILPHWGGSLRTPF